MPINYFLLPTPSALINNHNVPTYFYNYFDIFNLFLFFTSEHLEAIAPDLVAEIENVFGSSASLRTSHSSVLSQHCQSTQPLQGMDFNFEPLDDIQLEWGHFTSCCKRKSKKRIKAYDALHDIPIGVGEVVNVQKKRRSKVHMDKSDEKNIGNITISKDKYNEAHLIKLC
ncbi:hypothetical protein VNO78_10856 [Psophocarpus tetragonolobus]|uniref:Uncharacterized protein n=1 Tax=Psophocarpus tetragonolobus TaxID=3891 RepID=A0AAN9XML7_PSOTE